MDAGNRWLVYGCLVLMGSACAASARAQHEQQPVGDRQYRTNEYGNYGDGSYGRAPADGGQSSYGQYGGQPLGNAPGQQPVGNQQHNGQQFSGQQYNRQQFGPPVRVADARGLAPQGPVQPSWLPLDPREVEYIDQLLKFWEFKSAKIDRYRCRFKRWQYDPVFGPRSTFHTYSEGSVQYSAPDKGLFKVESTLYYTPPKAEGEEPKYVEREGETTEHWVCDGRWIYEFDYKQQKLFQRELPPEMQGKAIVEGPLPFLFGAKVDSLKQRYWFHVVTPRDAKGEYWLEAVPKMAQDAANFKKVEVILAEEDYLPKAIQIYPVNYDPRSNPARTVFEFERREVNFHNLANLIPFNKQFFDPATPSGWERVVEPFRADAELGRLPPR